MCLGVKYILFLSTHCGSSSDCLELDAEGKPIYADGLAVLGAFIEIDPHMEDSDINDRVKILLAKAGWLNKKNNNSHVMKGKNAQFSLG